MGREYERDWIWDRAAKVSCEDEHVGAAWAEGVGGLAGAGACSESPPGVFVEFLTNIGLAKAPASGPRAKR